MPRKTVVMTKPEAIAKTRAPSTAHDERIEEEQNHESAGERRADAQGEPSKPIIAERLRAEILIFGERHLDASLPASCKVKRDPTRSGPTLAILISITESRDLQTGGRGHFAFGPESSSIA